MTRASKTDKWYSVAERMYVRQGAIITDIAHRCQVHPNTVSKWCSDGDWKEKRAKWLKSNQGYLERLEEQRDKALTAFEGDATASNLDRLVKLNSMAATAARPLDLLAAVIEVMDKWATFIRRRDPELAERQEPLLREFFGEVERVA